MSRLSPTSGRGVPEPVGLEPISDKTDGGNLARLLLRPVNGGGERTDGSSLLLRSDKECFPHDF